MKNFRNFIPYWEAKTLHQNITISKWLQHNEKAKSCSKSIPYCTWLARKI